mgnify:CR=1 FL=1
MPKRVSLVLALLILFCNCVLSAEKPVEKTIIRFTIDHFDNGGRYCGDKETMVIVPGTVENARPGTRYTIVRLEKDQWRSIGEVEIIWSVDWESKARAHLYQGESMVKIDDRIAVEVDVEKGFKLWWDKGTAWEKQNNWYDAFRAYFRCHTYKPADAKVNVIYLRSGYMDYLTQGKQSMERKNFRGAIRLFETALLYKWPDGDVSEAEKLKQQCVDSMTKDRDDFGEKLANADKAAAEKRYQDALVLYRATWIYHTSVLGSDKEKEELQGKMKGCWNSLWRSLKTDAERAYKLKKDVEAAYGALFSLRFIVQVIEEIRFEEYYALLDKLEALLPAASVSGWLATLTNSMVTSQKEDGSFMLCDDTEPLHHRAMGTSLGIALLALSGHSRLRGKHAPAVRAAYGWITGHKNSESAILPDQGQTAHTWVTWALSELLLASGDETVRGELTPLLNYLATKQSDSGVLGTGLREVNTTLTCALAAIAYDNASEAAISAPGRVYEKLKTLGYGMAGTEGKPSAVDSVKPAEGSKLDALVTGATLAILRGSGANMVGKNGMPLIQRSIKFLPGVDCPEAWYLAVWGLSEFSSEEWIDLHTAVVSSWQNSQLSEGEPKLVEAWRRFYQPLAVLQALGGK